MGLWISMFNRELGKRGQFRYRVRAALAKLAAKLVVLFFASSIAYAQDEIRFADKTTHKETSVLGTILEESPSRLVYKPGTGAGTKEVPALDITDVIYELTGPLKQAYRRALADEKRAVDPTSKDEDRQKAGDEAIKEYQDILPSLTGERQKPLQRHVHYKIARLLARQAEDNAAQLDRAIDALQKFKKTFADGWQISDAARLLARMQVLKGDVLGAEKTYQDLAAIPGIPPEVQQECELRAVDALIQGKKYEAAETKLQALQRNVPSGSPQAARVRIYLVLCQGASGKMDEGVRQLEELIAQTADKDQKAVAYNALGDCYRLNGKPKEALWPYLWVDVIYHQDRREHLKAIEQLAKLFDDQGDKTRAKQYRDRVRRETK
jgi:tetratricopeptide (TPR) repeat protein